MGVNLTPITVRHPVSLESLRGRGVAVDGNLELYQFLSIMRTRDGSPLMDSQGRVTSHLNGLMFRTTRLLSDFGIRPVFVFDGPPPELKRGEIARRREAREKARQAYERAIAAGDLGTARSKAVSATRLTRDMIDDAKTLLTYLGIPWVQAPSEGEAEAAFLAQRGDVWAAGSKDYDSLLFGAPRLVRFLAVQSTEFLPSLGRSRRVSPEFLDLAENLASLGLTREQLIDAAILVGTDFFVGVRGIGPKTAVKRLREWGSLDHAPQEVRADLPSTLDEIRAFFRAPPVTADVDLRLRPVRAGETKRFLCDERGFAEDRVARILARLAESRPPTARLEDFADSA
jgi:flap endonuclease-1